MDCPWASDEVKAGLYMLCSLSIQQSLNAGSAKPERKERRQEQGMAQAIAIVKAFYRGITYRGREGHWAWMMHRVAGLGVLLFLFLHVFDIFLIGFGPDLFNKFLFVYHSPPFRVLILFLIYGLLYHALNGLRVIVIDFWPSMTRYERPLFWVVMAIVVPVWLFAAYHTMAPILTSH
jgi:succinate dehydrogenase / fumarate reductase cytochrome b subunit